jgi:hypothetical protein
VGMYLVCEGADAVPSAHPIYEAGRGATTSTNSTCVCNSRGICWGIRNIIPPSLGLPMMPFPELAFSPRVLQSSG